MCNRYWLYSNQETRKFEDLALANFIIFFKTSSITKQTLYNENKSLSPVTFVIESFHSLFNCHIIQHTTMYR